MNILTIDVGGSEIKSAVYQHNGALVSDFPSQKTNKTSTSNAISQQIINLCDSIQSNHHLSGVAIATAGVVDPIAGKVLYAGSTIPQYSQTPLKAQIEKGLKLPCNVENDVNAMAMGEAWLGIAKNCESALCLTLGTGLGGALLINGKLYRGYRFSAGEIGYFPQHDGLRLEEKASTTALLEYYRELTGEKINGKVLFTRLNHGDPHAQTALTKMLDALAQGLVPAILLVAPEMIVMGGGITTQKKWLETPLREALSHHLPSEQFMPKEIRCASLGNRAGMLGALRCFLDQDSTREV